MALEVSVNWRIVVNLIKSFFFLFSFLDEDLLQSDSTLEGRREFS